MTVPFVDLSRHVAGMREELDRAVAGVLDRGRFVLGATVEEFERAFADYCGAAHAVGVASGTDAVTISLEAIGVGPGDEVITAANTCVPTVAGIEGAGAIPVLADVDPETWTLDPRCLEGALSERTRAIVPVQLYGQCADMEPILSFAQAHGLMVVEDAAQAHGADYRGQRAGTLGAAAAFSFYPTKNLGALGDAGAVVTNDPDVAERARQLRMYGERERNLSLVRGRNSRLDTLQAAALLVKLPYLDGWNERRRAIASSYLGAFRELPIGLPVEAVGRRHVYHLFSVRVPDRERFRAALAGAGVETLTHYPRAVHEHPAYAELGRAGELSVSEAHCREVVSLPLYPELTDGEVDRVVSVVREAVR